MRSRVTMKRKSKLLIHQGHRPGCDITKEEYDYYTRMLAERRDRIRDSGRLLCDTVGSSMSQEEYDEMIKEELRQERDEQMYGNSLNGQ